MPTALVRPLCYATLFGVWVVDLLTPQLFVAAIFMNVPIALSSLVFDERLTRFLVGLALAANISAGYVNGLAVDAHWDAIAIGDRIISGFSFLLVGLLTIASQRSAHEAGELAERNERANRERRISDAIDRIRSSMSTELVRRAVAREAREALDADETWFIEQTSASAESTIYHSSAADVTFERGRADAPVASLARRVLEEGAPARVDQTDALGRLVLATLGADDAVAAPISDATTPYGVLIVAKSLGRFGDHVIEGVRTFTAGSAAALSQSALFEQLARRNDELAAANRSLQERTNVIRDIVYALSHDLRTPLTAAGMTMRQALEGRYGELPGAFRTILEQSVRSNDELLRLAETLLLVSKYESGEGSARRERVEVPAVLREVMDELSPLALSKDVTFALAGIAGEVLADPSELRRAFTNLIANAITWSRSGSTIAIAVGARDGKLDIIVEDEGFGVPAGVRERIFERISPESRSGAGSGLGLYIVRRIAQGHGGSVAYEPREQGGSRFTLSLPLAPARS